MLFRISTANVVVSDSVLLLSVIRITTEELTV